MKLKKSKRPLVLVNFAMTADGKIAFANRHFDPFSSKRDAKHMLELRATADAVMAGARTVDSNAVTMGPGGAKFRKLRLERGLAEYNLRIIVSGSGNIDCNAEIFRHRFSPIIILTTARAARADLARMRAVANEVKICGRREINFPAALRWLRAKWGVKRLLCEGGGALHDALLRAGLVDELHLTVCPKIFGGQNTPTIADGTGVRALADATAFQIKSLKRAGDELFAIFENR
jgi:riboflavin-specific deaminase-like protein